MEMKEAHSLFENSRALKTLNCSKLPECNLNMDHKDETGHFKPSLAGAGTNYGLEGTKIYEALCPLPIYRAERKSRDALVSADANDCN